MLVLGVFLLRIFVYSLVAHRLEKTVLTGPIIFTTAGMLLGWYLPRRQAQGVNHEAALLAVYSPTERPALLSWLAAGSVGSNRSIPAFVAGLAIRLTYQEMKAISLAFGEAAGQLLNLAVFFLFGALVVGQFRHFSPAFALYAVASLTLIRMVPVAISMIGTGLNSASVLFMGWFGPRGLASFVLGLVYLKQHAGLPGESLIPTTGFLTVLVSIYAHGFSALPGIKGYPRRLAWLDPSAPEYEDTSPAGVMGFD